jgi:hypothetical protein
MPSLGVGDDNIMKILYSSKSLSSPVKAINVQKAVITDNQFKFSKLIEKSARDEFCENIL